MFTTSKQGKATGFNAELFGIEKNFEGEWRSYNNKYFKTPEPPANQSIKQSNNAFKL